MGSFAGSACLCDGGSVFWAALHVVTACCSKALMCLRYGKLLHSVGSLELEAQTSTH